MLWTGLEAALAGEAIGTAAGVALPSAGAEQEEEQLKVKHHLYTRN